MFNLLPENLKNKIKKDYNLRRAVVVFAFIIFLGATFLVFLFPSWIVSIYKEEQFSLQAKNSNQSTLEGDVNVVALNIKKINSELRTVDTAFGNRKVIPTINIILSKKTKSISIKELTYKSEDPTNVTVFIEGVSATRGSLLAFVKSLEETKAFKAVNLPISNFAKDKDIAFSINLILETK